MWCNFVTPWLQFAPLTKVLAPVLPALSFSPLRSLSFRQEIDRNRKSIARKPESRWPSNHLSVSLADREISITMGIKSLPAYKCQNNYKKYTFMIKIRKFTLKMSRIWLITNVSSHGEFFLEWGWLFITGKQVFSQLKYL